jgi:hypothetical protein
MKFATDLFKMERPIKELNLKCHRTNELFKTNGRIFYFNEYPDIKFCVAKVMGGYKAYHYKSGLTIDRQTWSSHEGAIIGSYSYIQGKKVWGDIYKTMLQHENDGVN